MQGILISYCTIAENWAERVILLHRRSSFNQNVIIRGRVLITKRFTVPNFRHLTDTRHLSTAYLRKCCLLWARTFHDSLRVKIRHGWLNLPTVVVVVVVVVFWWFWSCGQWRGNPCCCWYVCRRWRPCCRCCSLLQSPPTPITRPLLLFQLLFGILLFQPATERLLTRSTIPHDIVFCFICRHNGNLKKGWRIEFRNFTPSSEKNLNFIHLKTAGAYLLLRFRSLQEPILEVFGSLKQSKTSKYTHIYFF